MSPSGRGGLSGRGGYGDRLPRGFSTPPARRPPQTSRSFDSLPSTFRSVASSEGRFVRRSDRPNLWPPGRDRRGPAQSRCWGGRGTDGARDGVWAGSPAGRPQFLSRRDHEQYSYDVDNYTLGSNVWVDRPWSQTQPEARSPDGPGRPSTATELFTKCRAVQANELSQYEHTNFFSGYETRKRDLFAAERPIDIAYHQGLKGEAPRRMGDVGRAIDGDLIECYHPLGN